MQNLWQKLTNRNSIAVWIIPILGLISLGVVLAVQSGHRSLEKNTANPTNLDQDKLAVTETMIQDYHPDADCLQAVADQRRAYDADPYAATETFGKYRVEVYNGPLAPLNLKTSSKEAVHFRTNINDKLTEAGINFAGKYSLVSVGMTGWGSNYFLVDRTNGRGVIFPDNIILSDMRKDSALLIINPKDAVLENQSNENIMCANTGTMDVFYPDLRPAYYVLEGDKFRVISQRSQKNQFWIE